MADDDLLYFFSDRAFNEFRREIEIRSEFRSKWRYSGGVDLLFTNARLREDEAEIDFSTTTSADLVEMKADGAILAVDNFVERIIQYSESQTGDDPTGGSAILSRKNCKLMLKRRFTTSLQIMCCRKRRGWS